MADDQGKTTEQETDDQGQDPGKREQRYKERARDAESALETSNALVTRYQRQEALRLAGEHLGTPEDLLTLGGVELADLIHADGDDVGTVNGEKVAEVAASIVEKRGPQFGVNYDPRENKPHGAGGKGGHKTPRDRTGGQMLIDSINDHGHPQK